MGSGASAWFPPSPSCRDLWGNSTKSDASQSVVWRHLASRSTSSPWAWSHVGRTGYIACGTQCKMEMQGPMLKKLKTLRLQQQNQAWGPCEGKALCNCMGRMPVKPALSVDQDWSSKPFTKWSLDQGVYLFSTTLVYALAHSHTHICVGEGPLKLFKWYRNGVIFKLLKKHFPPPPPAYQSSILAHGRHLYSQGILVFFLKKESEVKDIQLLKLKLIAWKQIFKIPLRSSSHSLSCHYNINYQSWWAQLIDHITRLWQRHCHMFITPVSYCSWTPRKMVFPSLSCS